MSRTAETVFYATVWDDVVDTCYERHGPYKTAAIAKQIATKLHRKTGVLTAYEEYDVKSEKVVDSTVWPRTVSNQTPEFFEQWAEGTRRKKFWRTLVVVDDYLQDMAAIELSFHVVAWGSERARISLNDLPDKVLRAWTAGQIRFHAKVNLGAEVVEELEFKDWEV